MVTNKTGLQGGYHASKQLLLGYIDKTHTITRTHLTTQSFTVISLISPVTISINISSEAIVGLLLHTTLPQFIIHTNTRNVVAYFSLVSAIIELSCTQLCDSHNQTP